MSYDHLPRSLQRILLVSLLWAFGSPAFAKDLLVRVLDCGQGESIVARMTDQSGKVHYFVYDTGPGNGALAGIRKFIPAGSTVELLVISHNDSDHIGGVDEVLRDYRVTTIWHPGDHREADSTADNAEEAIDREIPPSSIHNLNFAHSPESFFGATFDLGEAQVTLIAGWSVPPKEWKLRGSSELHNGGSIVVKLEYRGISLLFCGDTVGRHLEDPPGACIGAEKFMVDHVLERPLKSDVIVAPHHGADNGSSNDFIAAVHPTYVIFSAGTNATYRHPRQVAARRYLDAHVDLGNMFRTDLGDDEKNGEWTYGRIAGNRDPIEDDDVDIVIDEQGKLDVGYSTQHPGYRSIGQH